MGSRQKTHAIAGLLFIALSVSGCAQAPVPPPNEYKIALQELDTSWLDECQGLGDKPDRKVGSLLADFTTLAPLASICRTNHNALVEYLKPLIEKAKAGDSQ